MSTRLTPTFSSDYDDYDLDAHGAYFGSVTGTPGVGPTCG